MIKLYFMKEAVRYGKGKWWGKKSEWEVGYWGSKNTKLEEKLHWV